MHTQQSKYRGADNALRLGGVHLDPAEVFGVDVAVLLGTDEPGRRSMVTVERTAIEAVRDEDIVSQGVLDRHD